MPAKDLYHEHVKEALIKDGWVITDDPLKLKWGKKNIFVDFGAERLIIAEKGVRKIAVEVKSFLSDSEFEDMYGAIGQYILYRSALETSQNKRELFLAVRETIYLRIFDLPEYETLRATENIKLIVFDPQTKEIIKWIT